MYLKIKSKTRALKGARFFSVMGVFATLFVSAANAQTDYNSLSQLTATATTAAPYALFDYSTITGSANTISVSWLPVVLANGSILYKDIALTFQIDSAGNVTLASGYPLVSASPILNVSGFRAAKYVGPSTIVSGNAIVNVSGPGVTTGGATEWSLAAASGAAGCTYPGTATWYVGPIATSPIGPRLKAAGLTSTAWSYGVGTSPCGGSWFYNNALLGFSQVGNTITIVNFTNTSGADQGVPQAEITFALAP